ncbi:MAG: thiamine diphosphokinase, partial [Chloroflexi bacterium RBG_16_48_8]
RSRLNNWGQADVIAANGGSLHAETLGLPIHAVIGDLDSLSEETQAALSAQDIYIQRAPSEKDETDLELALIYAAEQGAREIVVLGAFGGRIDMSIANLLLLTHPQLAKIRIEIWNGTQTAWIIRPPGDEVQGQVGDTLSLIPLKGEAKGVTTRNLAYPLNDEMLPAGPSRGLSNVLTSSTASVRLREGFLLAVHTPGRA